MHLRLRTKATVGGSSIGSMTTVTPNLEHETRRAWSDYADRLHGLEGAEYDRAEQEAWEHLQATLHALGVAESPLHDPPVG